MNHRTSAQVNVSSPLQAPSLNHTGECDLSDSLCVGGSIYYSLFPVSQESHRFCHAGLVAGVVYRRYFPDSARSSHHFSFPSVDLHQLLSWRHSLICISSASSDIFSFLLIPRVIMTQFVFILITFTPCKAVIMIKAQTGHRAYKGGAISHGSSYHEGVRRRQQSIRHYITWSNTLPSAHAPLPHASNELPWNF
jgi:hypothetical protein